MKFIEIPENLRYKWFDLVIEISYNTLSKSGMMRNIDFAHPMIYNEPIRKHDYKKFVL